MIRIVEMLEPTAGGTRTHLRNVIAALSPDEFEVRVVCSDRRDSPFDHELRAFRDGSATVVRLSLRRAPHPLWDPAVIVQLRRLLRIAPCDILHLHSSKAGWLGRLAAAGSACRVVYSPHCFAFQQTVAAPLRRCYEAAERLAGKWTDLLLAVDPEEARLAIEHRLVPPERVRVLPNAVDVAATEAVLRGASPFAPSGARTFGFIGELRRQKDPSTFLDAVLRLRERGVVGRFLLPAQGPERDRVRRLIHRERLDDVVELVPAPESLGPLFRRIDVAVLPSRWEASPYALLEALALGRPVIASRLPSTAPIIASLDDDLLFTPGDGAQLADRIETWLRAPRERLASAGARGRRYVVERHDMTKWRATLRDVYRELAAKSSGPARPRFAPGSGERAPSRGASERASTSRS